ncbi:hypothetical protein JXL19_06960 [bacterium]|nr:hypothetical protein [bacterium]
MTGSNLKTGKLWIFLLFSVIALVYALWWAICVYMPYNKKKAEFESRISALEHEINKKRANLIELKDADESLRSSLARIQDIRSRLPDLNNIIKFTDHLKKRGLDHNLLVEEDVPDTHLISSPYPARIQIYPVPVTLRLKGDFLFIGRYIQSLDEEERFFCHIKSVMMERVSNDISDVSAQIKMEVFCKKTDTEGKMDEIF